MPESATSNFTVPSTPSFRRWLTDAAERLGYTESTFVEKSIRLLAEREGLEPPPKRASRPGRPARA